MRVFVAGATGVAGKEAVRELVSAGHVVTGVARSAEKALLLERFGARPVAIDLFEATAVKRAISHHEAVVNVTTHIPPFNRTAVPGSWNENDAIRREVSRNLRMLRWPQARPATSRNRSPSPTRTEATSGSRRTHHSTSFRSPNHSPLPKTRRLG